MAENELKMAGGEDEDKAAVPWLSVKEEPHDDDPVFPRPIEGLRDIAPSPFLKKTYEMVDDPRTDSIISWDLTKTSFVVWDPHRFSKDLLPTHFKHSNFASFVRQLNTYRFRKIDSDRCEFANVLFKHGNKHLLNHIKRRKPNSQITPQQLLTTTPNCCLNPDSRGIMEMEVEKLKTDHGILQMEVLQLRQQQENTRLHLASAIDRLHTAETKQKHMALFFIKFLKNPVLLQFFTEKVGKLRDRNLKKRRLAGIDTERVREAPESDEIADESIINDDYDDKAMFVSCDESGNPREQKKTDVNCPYETNSLDACSESFVLWEKLMEDDMIYEDEKQKSDVVSELEDLVSPKPARAMFR